MALIKIASASSNQTGGDWPGNMANICEAIDKAVADGADLLCLEELGLSGYDRGDDFDSSDNTTTRRLLQVIADYAASKNSNLIISIGHPWYLADKHLPDQLERCKNPVFNRLNKPYNVQTLISGGRIISMSAKRYLFNYERGYEERHFQAWSDVFANQYTNQYGRGREGTITITLPGMVYADGTKLPDMPIPFGSPVVEIRDQSGALKLNVTHIICEEYWIGSRFDGNIDNSQYDKDNPLAQTARKFDISVAINPNASPPVAKKIKKHYELAKLATRHCSVLVHTDGLGSSGSTFAQFGSRLIAQNEAIISEGERASFKNVAYTSKVVKTPPVKNKGHSAHSTISHEFNTTHTPPVQDGPAAWEKGPHLEIEEELRIECLWLFDYMRKNNITGFIQALSGGSDSAYNAAKVRLMAELAIKDLGFDGFFAALNYPEYEQEVMKVYTEEGNEAAIDRLMKHILTCVYMGTDNSSEETLRAAKTLIEGGTTAEGVAFKGIGGTFHNRNVQRLVDVYAQIFSGANPSILDDTQDAEIRKEIGSILGLHQDATTPEELENRIVQFKQNFEVITHDVLSAANKKHSISYENLQARLRQVLIMLFANVENKMAIANANLYHG